MKQGKKPTLRQMKEIKANGLDPNNWFIERNTSTEMGLVHRLTGKKRTILKGA